MKARIALLPGDGIGPEVTASARQVLEAVASRFGHQFEFRQLPVGGAAIDGCGSPLPRHTLEECRAADAVLLGAVGGPAWEGCALRPEAGLLELRRALGVFANLRPLAMPDALLPFSPLKPERVRGADLLVVRELTGGIYFGQPRRRTSEDALDTMVYARDDVLRVAHVAFLQARARRKVLTSVDKANVLESSRLWREVVNEVASEYPDVRLEHQLVDSMATALIVDPRRFDVILTSNLFGDILSDEVGALAGSLGALPSASIGTSKPGLFEPVHGSAPGIADKGVANPVGAILSGAMLCHLGLSLPMEAEAIVQAVAEVFKAGVFTSDFERAASASTEAFANAVVENLMCSPAVAEKKF